MDFIGLLETWREERCLSSAELARRMGITPQEMNRLKRNRNPKLLTASRAAQALGLSLQRFLDGPKKKAPQ